MTDRKKPHTIFDAMSLSATDGIMLSDGTLWSHAATLGTRVKGTEFTIDRATVDNFVKVFGTGYPQKVPVDYEHASTSDDPEVRRLRAQGQVPKAGDVLELRGVFAPGDFTAELKAAAAKLCAEANPPRSLDDTRNYGLWMRWKPTARALNAIKAREYTELSITFDDDWPDNTTGEGQGPTIVAVALTNLPFLDDMLPVAASRSDHLPPVARERPASREGSMSKLTVLSVAAALFGRAATNEDDALQELSQLGPQLQELRTAREFRSVIGAEIGETDAVKAAAKVRELKVAVDTAKAEATAQKTAAITTQVDATLKKYESRLTVPLKELMGTQLRGELEAGTKLDETKTVKALESLKPTGITTQTSSADVGTGDVADDELLDRRAHELMREDTEVKELTAKHGFTKGFRLALVKADKELGAKK